MIEVRSASAAETRDLGERLGETLVAGDLVMLHGDLGAGKTTFTQGIAKGMGVEGRVVSPTFIVSRVHSSAAGGPELVHVDAYRVEGDEDLETLDLDSALQASVAVVEWGAGKVEALSPDRLEVTLTPVGAEASWTELADEDRLILFEPHGKLWEMRLAALLGEGGEEPQSENGSE